MAEGATHRFAHDLMSEPHIRGLRISVRQLYALVEERSEDPEAVADRYDLDVADVYHALAYYHDHPREMNEVRKARDEEMADLHDSVERPGEIDPHDM